MNTVMLENIQMLNKENKLNSCNLKLMDSAIEIIIHPESNVILEMLMLAAL